MPKIKKDQQFEAKEKQKYTITNWSTDTYIKAIMMFTGLSLKS